ELKPLTTPFGVNWAGLDELLASSGTEAVVPNVPRPALPPAWYRRLRRIWKYRPISVVAGGSVALVTLLALMVALSGPTELERSAGSAPGNRISPAPDGPSPAPAPAPSRLEKASEPESPQP